MTDDQNEDYDPHWADRERERAALMARHADLMDDVAARMHDTASDPVARAVSDAAGLESPTQKAAEVAAHAYDARTQQRIHAENARNYDAVLAAGGPANPEAKAAWIASLKLSTHLMHGRDDS